MIFRHREGEYGSAIKKVLKVRTQDNSHHNEVCPLLSARLLNLQPAGSLRGPDALSASCEAVGLDAKTPAAV